MENLLNLFVKSVFIENMVFAYFLGMCSYLAAEVPRPIHLYWIWVEIRVGVA